MIDDIYVNDAETPWWTPVTSFDNKQDQNDRLEEFEQYLRFCDAKNPIFVGHSLFFKLFYSTRITGVLKSNRPELYSNLKKFRLGNASVLAVTVIFSKNDNAFILDADVLFGGGFHGQESHTPGPKQRRNSAAGAAGLTQDAFDQPSSSGQSRLSSLMDGVANALSMGGHKGRGGDDDEGGGNTTKRVTFTEKLSMGMSNLKMRLGSGGVGGGGGGL